MIYSYPHLLGQAQVLVAQRHACQPNDPVAMEPFQEEVGAEYQQLVAQCLLTLKSVTPHKSEPEAEYEPD